MVRWMAWPGAAVQSDIIVTCFAARRPELCRWPPCYLLLRLRNRKGGEGGKRQQPQFPSALRGLSGD